MWEWPTSDFVVGSIADHDCKNTDRVSSHEPLLVIGEAPVKLMPVPVDRAMLVTVPPPPPPPPPATPLTLIVPFNVDPPPVRM